MRDGSKTRIAFAGAGATLALLLADPTPATAHHSYAMFDHAKLTTLTGAVLTWEMTNPHSYLWVIVKTAGGAEQTWGLEGGGIMALTRAGVSKSAVKPGEKVTVELHPLRDGRTGGQLLSVKLADGRMIRMGGGGGGEGGEAPKAPGV